MSEQLGINQGDSIYYYDLSTGAVSREWTFQGGTPSTSTAYGPDIKYYGVNYTGYSTELVITGAGGITAAAFKSNIIVVYPEIFSPDIEITQTLDVIAYDPPISKMSSPVTYTAAGTVSSGYASHFWDIPQLGPTSGALLSSVTYSCTDWYSLTGTYMGAPASSYLSNAILSFSSVVDNGAVVNKNINFRKIGVDENINYWSPGTYATGGKYYNVSTLSLRTSAIGLSGNNIVLKIDLGPYSPRWDNISFHSTQEAVYLCVNSPDISKSYSPIKTNMVLTGTALIAAGVTGGYSSMNRIMLGNYIIPNDVSSKFDNRFYITDNGTGSIFTNLIDGLRKWNTDAVNDFVSNKYYLSGSSKFIEIAGYRKVYDDFTMTFTRPPFADLASGIGYKENYTGYAWDGGWWEYDGYVNPQKYYHGVCIPTGALLEEKYDLPSAVDVDIRITLRDSSESEIADFEFKASPWGNMGNSPDKYLICAADTSFGSESGIAKLINSEIAAQPGGLSDNIIFEVNYNLCPYADGGAELLYANEMFGALKMSIKDPLTSATYGNKYIHSLEIGWGSQMSDFINGAIIDHLDFPAVPFASDVKQNGADMASWTGLPSKITVPASSESTYFRGWRIGGEL
jgi:hypothetical protein